MKRTLLRQLFCFLVLCQSTAYTQIYSNGSLVTGSVTWSGFAAPSGYSWSELQHNTGNITQANSTSGLPAYYYADGSVSYALADDFIVPNDQTWEVTSFDFYGYQPVYSGALPPVNALRIRLYNSDPSLPGASPIAGDLVTNVYDAANSENAFVYRVFNSLYPTPQQPNFSRKVFKMRGNLNITLLSGHYWVEFQVHASDNTEIFFPPVTVLGSRAVPGANSKINVISSVFPNDVIGWGINNDTGIPVSASDVALALPFQINGTVLGINEIELPILVVSPNPVRDVLNVSSANDISGIEVYNMLGQQVFVKPINAAQSQIDLSQLNSGTYLVKVVSDGQQKTIKVVKE